MLDLHWKITVDVPQIFELATQVARLGEKLVSEMSRIHDAIDKLEAEIVKTFEEWATHQHVAPGEVDELVARIHAATAGVRDIIPDAPPPEEPVP